MWDSIQRILCKQDKGRSANWSDRWISYVYISFSINQELCRPLQSKEEWPWDWIRTNPPDSSKSRSSRLLSRRSQPRRHPHPAHRPPCASPFRRSRGTPTWPCDRPYTVGSRGPDRCCQWCAHLLPHLPCLGIRAWWWCILRSPVRSRIGWRSHVSRERRLRWCNGTAAARFRPRHSAGFSWCYCLHGPSPRLGIPRTVGWSSGCCGLLVSVRSCRLDCLSSTSSI